MPSQVDNSLFFAKLHHFGTTLPIESRGSPPSSPLRSDEAVSLRDRGRRSTRGSSTSEPRRRWVQANSLVRVCQTIWMVSLLNTIYKMVWYTSKFFKDVQSNSFVNIFDGISISLFIKQNEFIPHILPLSVDLGQITPIYSGISWWYQFVYDVAIC